MKNERIVSMIPENLQFYSHGRYIEIVRTRLSRHTLIIVVCAIVWNGFLVKQYFNVNENTPFPAIFIGVGLAYYAVVEWLNKMHIYVSDKKIAIKHKPVPWFGNREIPVSNIKQLYAKEEIDDSGEEKWVNYEIHAVTRSGDKIKIAGWQVGSEQALMRDQALFIARQVESYLNIKHEPVKGELS